MHFALIDRVLEHDSTKLVGLKAVSLSEEYLQDHFPSFPVLPGVFMLEAMVQAVRMHLELRDKLERYVLGEVRALKYGSFVRPGEVMHVEVARVGEIGKEGYATYKGQVSKREFAASSCDRSAAAQPQDQVVCASGRIVLRPVRRRT